MSVGGDHSITLPILKVQLSDRMISLLNVSCCEFIEIFARNCTGFCSVLRLSFLHRKGIRIVTQAFHLSHGDTHGKKLGLIHIDAHADTGDKYLGSRFHHGIDTRLLMCVFKWEIPAHFIPPIRCSFPCRGAAGIH